MRVLLVKMSSLGDVIHTLPALTDAALALPGIRFDWVVEEAFAEIPAWHPAVERVIPVALRRWRKRPLVSLRGPEWRRARNALDQVPYDAVIDAQGLIKSALVASRVNAPRYGMDRHTVRERLACLAYQHKIHVPRDMHAVDRTRLLFARALGYAPPVGKGDYGVREYLAPETSLQSRSLLFFHGTARAEKLWPEPYWVELATLAAQCGYRALLPWGSSVERERATRIAEQLAQAQVLPRLNLHTLAGELLGSSGAVAVDTGLGHLAAALDVPTVSLYGPTSTRLVGAYGKNQSHIQSPLSGATGSDGGAMMHAIEPSLVWRELQRLLPGEN